MRSLPDFPEFTLHECELIGCASPFLRLDGARCCRGVAQLVEHRSPKPRATGSNPVTPAILFSKANPTIRLRSGS